MLIRLEQPDDIAAIHSMAAAAFAGHPHSDGSEPRIVDGLRTAGALALSLVAEEENEIVGHIAFSPVRINGEVLDWYGLGPLAVRPERQGQGIGTALILNGLTRLRALGAKGCVLVGEPDYYRRFEFATDDRLTFDGVPPEYFMALAFGDAVPGGKVEYHRAFFEK